MKIEKISDKQIRCTLNCSDLHARHLSLHELAYGSEKARSLFREMLQMAMEQVGFETEDVPLMIEAVPLATEGIVLIITKIDDPEELDTRFSRFAPALEENTGMSGESVREFSGSAGELLESLKNMLDDVLEDASKETDSQTVVKNDTPKMESSSAEEGPAGNSVPSDITSVYVFRSLDNVLAAAHVLRAVYHGQNTLYKSAQDSCYYLAAHKSGHSPEEFNKICNILTEYGEKLRTHSGTEAYFREHMEALVVGSALGKLAGQTDQ